jgi:hypothetical protein
MSCKPAMLVTSVDFWVGVVVGAIITLTVLRVSGAL